MDEMGFALMALICIFLFMAWGAIALGLRNKE